MQKPSRDAWLARLVFLPEYHSPSCLVLLGGPVCAGSLTPLQGVRLAISQNSLSAIDFTSPPSSLPHCFEKACEKSSPR